MSNRTARAVLSNAGIRAAYHSRILTFINEMQHEILVDLLTTLAQNKKETSFAKDASPKQLELEFFFKELQSKSRSPEGAKKTQKQIEEFIAANLPKYQNKISSEARRIARKYILRIAKQTGQSQRDALVTAGAPVGVVARNLNEFGVKGYYLSKRAVEALPSIIQENTELITNIVSSDLSRIQDQLINSVTSKGSYLDLVKTLNKTSGFSSNRAKMVALDQTNKVTQAIQRENASELGINKAVWIHTPGMYISRRTHLEFNGKVFDLNKGLYDKEVGKYVVPGECIYCRCTFRPILPDYLLEGTTSKNEEL